MYIYIYILSMYIWRINEHSSWDALLAGLPGFLGLIASRLFPLPPARMRRRFCAPSGLPACSQLALEASGGSLEGEWPPSAS